MKFKILLCYTTLLCIAGCGQDFLVGVTKGGSGNGKPPDKPDFEDVIVGENFSETYQVWLSKPASDQCNGIQRSLKFINPVNQDIISEDTLLNVSKGNNFVQPIKIQIKWENTSTKSVTVIQPCFDEVFIDDDYDSKNTNHSFSQRCDVSTIELKPLDTKIMEKEFNFAQTIRAKLIHEQRIQFIPSHQADKTCDVLSIPFYIKNIK